MVIFDVLIWLLDFKDEYVMGLLRMKMGLIVFEGLILVMFGDLFNWVKGFILSWLFLKRFMYIVVWVLFFKLFGFIYLIWNFFIIGIVICLILLMVLLLILGMLYLGKIIWNLRKLLVFLGFVVIWKCIFLYLFWRVEMFLYWGFWDKLGLKIFIFGNFCLVVIL